MTTLTPSRAVAGPRQGVARRLGLPATAAVWVAVVAGVVSRVIVLRQGVAVEAGPVGEVFSRPRDAYTSSLVAAARAFDAALGGQP